MSTSEPSREVRTFLSRHVRNLDDLQFLMSLIQSGDRWWGVDTAAREFGFTLPEARAALERFAALNLMDIRVSMTSGTSSGLAPRNCGIPHAQRSTHMLSVVYGLIWETER